MAQPVILPLASALGVLDNPPPDAVDFLMKEPHLHSACADYPFIETSCIMCHEHARALGSHKCACKEALYESKDCLEQDAPLHKLLCTQAVRFQTTSGHQDPNRVRVIILHAKSVKADFAWATVTDAGLAIDHPALDEFRRSQTDFPAPAPELINAQVATFQETKWLGHCVLLWSLNNWKELPIQWANQTAIFMGGKTGHTNLFYGPMVISVLKQDMVHRAKRTPDHVAMRTLRQVADYIQMVDDNPCVPNPARFVPVPARYHPEPGLGLIPAVKLNDNAELAALGPLGMTARREEVFVPISSRNQGQGPAAVPFVLGLQWYARTARLDIVVADTAVADKVEPDFVWAQWALEIDPADPDDKVRQKRAGAVYAHLDRSIVLMHAGGGPLRIEHVDALSAYLHMNQEKRLAWATISKDGFTRFWHKKYGAGDVPSPYDLEASHPTNLFEDDAGAVHALEVLAADRGTKRAVVRFSQTRADALVQRLIKTYQDEQIIMIVEAFIAYWVGHKPVENVLLAMVSAAAGNVAEERLETRKVLEQLATTHQKWELRDMASYLNKFEKKTYLNWFQKECVKE